MRAVIKIPQMDMFSLFESSSFHLLNPARLGNEPYAFNKLTQIKITTAQYIVKLKCCSLDSRKMNEVRFEKDKKGVCYGFAQSNSGKKKYQSL